MIIDYDKLKLANYLALDDCNYCEHDEDTLTEKINILGNAIIALDERLKKVEDDNQ